MSVTIHQEPSNYNLSGNPLVVVFSSDETAQDNFSYKVEIYVNSVLVESHKLFPQFGIKSHIDISDVAERYCDIPTTPSGVCIDAGNYVDVEVKVIENYGTTPTDHLNDSSTFKVYKGKQSKINFLEWTPSDYSFGIDKSWLTTFPSAEKRYTKLSYNHYCMFITNSISLKYSISLYDSSGSLIQTIKLSSFTAWGDITTFNINETTLLGVGFPRSRVDSAARIDVKLFDNVGNYASTYVVYVDDRCISSKPYQLHFLSRIGSLESYFFIKKTNYNTSIKSSEFEKQFGYFDSDGNWAYNVGGVGDYIKELEDGIEVQTDWLNDDEYQWLCENFLTSPLVYFEINGEIYRCKVSESSYKLKTNTYDMVYSLKAKLIIERNTTTVV